MRNSAVVVVAAAGLSVLAFSACGATAPAAALKGGFTISVNGGLGIPTGRLALAVDPYALTGKAQFDAHDRFVPGSFIRPDLGNGTGLGQRPGANFGAALDYFLTSGLAIGADFAVASFTGKDLVLPANLPGDFVLDASGNVLDCVPLGAAVALGQARKASDFRFGVHGRYLVATRAPAAPYLQLGLGIYGRKIEAKDAAAAGRLGWTKQTDSKVGVNGGLGLDYRVNERISLGLGGAYHMVFGKFEKDLPNALYATNVKTTLARDWSYLALNLGVVFHLPQGR